MSLKVLLKAIYFWFFDDTSSLISRNITADKHYIEQLYQNNQAKLKDADNYLLRSFLQYKCQMHNIAYWKRIVLSLFSPFIMVLFIPYALLCGCFLKKSYYDEKIAVINGDIDEDLIPTSLKEQYRLVKIRNNHKFILDVNGFIWVIKVSSKYLFHPYFIFKLTIKTAQYSYLIGICHPKAIVTSSEYSFCSSALTYFSAEHRIQHLNIMHGDKGFNIRDSYFKFSRCYVWHNYYIDLFKLLNADENQFIVECPPRHQRIIAMGKTCQPIINIIKFYWALEYNQNEMLFIAEHLTRIKEMGFDIIIRYHPLHKAFFFKRVYPYFSDFKIEDPVKVDLYDSLLETEYVLGTYTTVLYEGYLMDRKLIISDFEYLSLLELSCISIRLPHIKLSEFKGNRYV